MIVELADFFETSVDVLLGYEWRDRGIGKTVELIKKMGHDKDYDTGKKEAEKALQKYPNCFEVIYYSAELYYMKGLEQHNKQELQRSKELYQRSLSFLSQNNDEEINEVIIHIRIGDIYMVLGEVDTAITYLKKYNYCGINSDKIGFYLAQQEKVDEAFGYLSDSALEVFSSVIRIGLGFVNCYSTIEDYDTAIDCLKCLNALVQGLKKTKNTSYMDKLSSILLAIIAQLYFDKRELTLSHEYLCQARTVALFFDANPEICCSNLKFYHGKEQPIYDDFGESAVSAIEKLLYKKSDVYGELLSYWNELNGGKQ